MQGHHKEKNEKTSLSPPEYCASLLNLFVTFQQSDSTIDENTVRYWAEI